MTPRTLHPFSDIVSLLALHRAYQDGEQTLGDFLRLIRVAEHFQPSEDFFVAAEKEPTAPQ